RNLPEWQSSVLETRMEAEGPVAVGSRWTEVRRVLGRKMEAGVEVTEYDPDRRFSVRSVAGPVRFLVEHTLEEAEGGTRIHIVGQGEQSGFMARLGDRLVARQAKQAFESDFDRLKQRLEAS
ncbi:MAG: SRPBCC family protein, partial [Actinomycetota bacterium]|nr:SRPBCC family protein [Actinomycetota bacterium]